MSSLMDEKEILRIREELMVIQPHAGRVAMSLERIADSLPIPFIPVPEGDRQHEENFRTALQIVREILDDIAPRRRRSDLNGPHPTPSDASRPSSTSRRSSRPSSDSRYGEGRK